MDNATRELIVTNGYLVSVIIFCAGLIVFFGARHTNLFIDEVTPAFLQMAPLRALKTKLKSMYQRLKANRDEVVGMMLICGGPFLAVLITWINTTN